MEEIETDATRLAATLNAAGLSCKQLANYDEGRALYERALDVLQADSGSQTGFSTAMDVATLYHNLGGIEHARGDYATAEPLARSAVDMRMQLLGPGRPAVAADMVALAAILDGLERFDEAEAMYVEALRVLEREPEANALEIAVALNNLGAQHLQRGLFDSAEGLLGRAAVLKRSLLGPDHPDVAVTINNLALLSKKRGNYPQAAALYDEAVEIFRQALGQNHPKTIACSENRSRSDPAAKRV